MSAKLPTAQIGSPVTVSISKLARDGGRDGEGVAASAQASAARRPQRAVGGDAQRQRIARDQAFEGRAPTDCDALLRGAGDRRRRRFEVAQRAPHQQPADRQHDEG